MNPTLSAPDPLHSLDSARDFVAAHGSLLGMVALGFFILGWCFGGLLWRRYKRQVRTAAATIESLKNEAAQLKRCIAGQTLRAQSGGPAGENAPLPPGRPFSLWTADDFEPRPEHLRQTWPPSAAFTLWTRGDFMPASTAPVATPAPAGPPAREAPFAATAPATVVRSVSGSQAFTLWTQASSAAPESGWVGGIAQRGTLAALIRSRVDVPPLPTLPPLDLEPLPIVPALERNAQAAER